MKKFILIFIIFVLYNFSFAQVDTKNNPTRNDITCLIPIEKISDDNQIILIISELINYDDAFIYNKEIKEGKFMIEKYDNKYIIRIYNIEYHNLKKNKRIYLDSVVINKVYGNIKGRKNDNNYDLVIDKLEKYVDVQKIKNKIKNNKSVSVWNPVFRNDVFVDKSILAGTLPYSPNRIFNRGVSNTYLHVPNTLGPADIYAECTDGVIVPDENGTNAKIFSVDQYWDRIIWTNKEFQYSPNFIRAWGDPGSGYEQFSFPTGITYGYKEPYTYGLRNIYVCDNGNNRIHKLEYSSYVNSFNDEIIKNNLGHPYDISFHQGYLLNDKDDDILWFTELGFNYDLKCLDANYGSDLFSFDQFQYYGQIYDTYPGRLDTYSDYTSGGTAVKSMLAYVDLNLNAVIFFHLNNGTGGSHSNCYPTGNPPLAFAAYKLAYND